MKNSMLCIVVMGLLTISVFAAENEWNGINGYPGSPVANVDVSESWTLGRVPGVGNDDFANLFFTGSSTNKQDMYISSTNQFAPSGIFFNGNKDPEGWDNDYDLYLDKSLTVSNIVFSMYYSGGGSGQHQQRFRLGTKEDDVTLTLTGNGKVFNMDNFKWEGFTMSGDIVLTGTNIIWAGNNNGTACPYGSCTFYFTNELSTIYLKQNSAGTSTMKLTYCKLFARTGQTWICDTNAYIHMNAYGNGDLIKTVDEEPFNNMDEVNILLSGSSAYHSTINFRGGEYGSFKMVTTGKRNCIIKSEGDMKFKGKFPGMDNSLYILGAGNPYATNPNSYRTQFVMNGFDLSVHNDLYLKNYALLYITDSDVYVGGDIIVIPYSVAVNGYYDSDIRIQGNENTVLSFAGSYQVLGRAVSTGDNLSKSTVNAVGSGGNQFYEVCCSSNKFAVASGSLAVDTYNVGFGTTNAFVTLTNAYWNNNPVVNTNETDRFGEKLLVNNLNIAADSTLDVNGQMVQVTTSLNLDSTAVLDLNIEDEVTVGTEITTFYGDGDQSADWAVFEDQVINGNKQTGFSAVYNSTDDKTYWKVSSVGGGTILIIK